jgi:hypothetical protein
MVLLHLLIEFWYTLVLASNICLIKLDQLKCRPAMQPQALHHKAWHVVIQFSLVEYDMCSCLLFLYCIYTTRLLSDRRFEDYPGEFDEF